MGFLIPAMSCTLGEVLNYTEGERIASNFQKKGPIVAVDEIITKEGEDEVDDIG